MQNLFLVRTFYSFIHINNFFRFHHVSSIRFQVILQANYLILLRNIKYGEVQQLAQALRGKKGKELKDCLRRRRKRRRSVERKVWERRRKVKDMRMRVKVQRKKMRQ